MTIRFDRDAEEQFLVKPAIIEVAQLTTEFARKHYSDRHYAGRNFELQVRWTPTEKFRAGAYLEGDNHQVRLSYGTAIEIYRDAFVLPLVCRRTLVNEAFDPIFGLLSYGNDRKDVLPASLSEQNAKLTIIRLVTTWLFMHEQAHLFQRHGEVAKAHGITELLSNDNGIEDGTTEKRVIEGREAATRHAFELAADSEAITTVMMAEAVGGMDEATLWCLTAGLMCMFRRFYNASSEAIADIPLGSHPHPAIRMRMAMNRMLQVIALPDFAGSAKWAGGVTHAQAVMDHAVYTADVFWHLRYLGLDARSPFLDTVVATEVTPPSYQQAVFDAWRAVRADIVAGHLGFGEGVVMFLREPCVIGAYSAPVFPAS